MTARTHLLTGAGSGIGRALAELLASRGDRLVLVARSAKRAQEIQRALPGHPCPVVDLSDPDAVVMAGGMLAELGPLDSLVHCAGVVELGRLDSMDPTSWAEQLQVNLTAPAILTRALLPSVRAAGGTVVFVNSTAGQVTGADWSAYGASKAGLRALADALRAEEADNGVRVTTVFPSRTATAMQAKVHRQEGRDYDATRWMRPETVAATIAHVLDLPADATMPEVTLRTAPSSPRASTPAAPPHRLAST